MTLKDIFLPASPVVNIRGAWKEAVLLFFILFLPGILSQGQEVDPEAFNRLSYHLRYTLIALPQILLVLYILHLQYPEGLQAFGLIRFRSRTVLSAVGVFIGIVFILMVSGMILSLLPEGQRNMISSNFSWKLRNPALLPAVLFTSLVTGYREELFFRSYLLGRFRQLSVPLPSAVLVSSLMFSLGHFYQGISGFLVSLLIGGFLAVIFWKRNNIHVVAIAHGLYNTLVLTLTLFTG